MTQTLSKPPISPALAPPATPPVDMLTVYVISAVSRFPAVRALVSQLGPSLFDDAAARRVVAAVITESDASSAGLTRTERARAAALAGAVARTQNPHTEDWAMHCLRLLAERRFGPLLADQLEWAAAELRAGSPVRRVLASVNEAARLALGITPFDGQETWGAES